MIRRLLAAAAAVSFVPALLAGCGGDDDGPAGRASADADRAAVSVSFDEPLRPGPVTWTVELTAGGSGLELTFRNGQRADVSLSRDGEVVYRWSRAQLFTQELGELSLEPRASRTFELEDELEVDAGEYELEAWITADGEREHLRTTRRVTVEPR